MKQIQRNLSVTGASLVAASLMLGAAGTASAVDIDVNGDLANVSGPVQSGNATPADARGNVTALLDFSVPSGEFGSDANALAGSSNPVDFSTTLNGTIETGGVFGDLDSTLNASNQFSSGTALADFLLGNSLVDDFDSATITSGPVNNAEIDNASAQILNPTFGGDGSATLANLTGGTLDLAGDQGALAGLNIDGQLVDGNGQIAANGEVDMGGGDDGDTGGGDDGDTGGGDDGDTGGGDDGDTGGDDGGMTDVPGPSGLGMLAMGLGLLGFGAKRRRQG